MVMIAIVLKIDNGEDNNVTQDGQNNNKSNGIMP